MKWCQRCNTYYYNGQVCPQCNSYLYDVPQQQQGYYQQSYYQPQTYYEAAPRKTSKAAVFFGLLSLLLAAALALSVWTMMDPSGTPLINTSQRSKDVDAAVFKSGYQWCEAVRELVEPYSNMQAQRDAGQTVEFGTPEAEEAMGQLGEAIGNLMMVGVLFQADYVSMINGPIQSLKGDYPSVVAAWDDIYAICLIAEGEDITTTVSSLEDFYDLMAAYKQAVSSAGLSTSGW